MIYDEKCRELAENLRDFVRARSFAHGDVAGGIGEVVEANELLYELFGEKNVYRPYGVNTFVDDCAVLIFAELIDRPTCRNLAKSHGMAPVGAIEWFECSECHCKARQNAVGMAIRHCPNCGSEVIDDAD